MVKWNAIYRKISLTDDPEVRSADVLNQWEKEGRKLTKWELCRVVKELRKYKRYDRALEVKRQIRVQSFYFGFLFAGFIWWACHVFVGKYFNCSGWVSLCFHLEWFGLMGFWVFASSLGVFMLLGKQLFGVFDLVFLSVLCLMGMYSYW